jgi:hypothetical protein
MQTKPFKLVAVALANKMARIAFAIMRGKTSYSADPAWPPTSSAAKGCTRIEGDQEVMRRARFDPKARGIDCAIKRDNVIGARDQRTTSGSAGHQDPYQQAEDMTVPTIIAPQQNNP